MKQILLVLLFTGLATAAWADAPLNLKCFKKDLGGLLISIQKNKASVWAVNQQDEVGDKFKDTHLTIMRCISCYNIKGTEDLDGIKVKYEIKLHSQPGANNHYSTKMDFLVEDHPFMMDYPCVKK